MKSGAARHITTGPRFRSLGSLQWNMALWRMRSVHRTGVFWTSRLVGPSLEWATSVL